VIYVLYGSQKFGGSKSPAGACNCGTLFLEFLEQIKDLNGGILKEKKNPW